MGCKTSVFKRCFPRRDIGPRVGARTHTRRGGAKRSTRSEAESCAGGLSWHNRRYEGELNQSSRLNEAKRNEGGVRMRRRHPLRVRTTTQKNKNTMTAIAIGRHISSKPSHVNQYLPNRQPSKICPSDCRLTSFSYGVENVL